MDHERTAVVTGAPQQRLLAAHVVWRLGEGGGIQTVIRQIAQGHDRARVDMHIVTSRPAFTADALDDLPVTMHPLGYRGSHRNPWARMTLGVRASRRLRALRPDVLHVHTGIPWLWFPAWLLSRRPRVVLEVHDAPGSGRHRAVTDWMEGRAARAARATLIVHSTSVRDAVARRWHAGEDQIVHYPLGVDTERISPLDAVSRSRWRHSQGIADGDLVLIGVGRFVPSKRFDLLVDAVAELRRRGISARCLLVGAGATEAAIRARAEELGVSEHMTVLGQLSGADLRLALAGADVLSSSSSYEGFGLTLVEGMAAGLPVVAMAVGGVTDIVTPRENGLLVANGDMDGFVAALVELSDAPTRARMACAARRNAVERFTVEQMVANTERLYADVAASRTVSV